MSIEELREQASADEFIEDAQETAQPETYHERRFLGLTAFQRFIIAILFFLISCMISGFILLVTQRVVLPFF
ncbi:MAG: hypothetical protein ACPL3P_02980 [Anaerolineales bacterium]